MLKDLRCYVVVKTWHRGPKRIPFFIDHLQAALAYDSQWLRTVEQHVKYVSDTWEWSLPCIQQQRRSILINDIKIPLSKDVRRIEKVAKFTTWIEKAGFGLSDILQGAQPHVDSHAAMRDVRRRIQEVSTLILQCISTIDSVIVDEPEPDLTDLVFEEEHKPSTAPRPWPAAQRRIRKRESPSKSVPWTFEQIGRESVMSRIQLLDNRLAPRPKEPEYNPKYDPFEDLCRECYLEEECICFCRTITEMIHIIIPCRKCVDAVSVKEFRRERGDYNTEVWKDHAQREQIPKESTEKKASAEA